MKTLKINEKLQKTIELNPNNYILFIQNQNKIKI